MGPEAQLPAGRRHRALLITDIVRSTENLARIGDARWRELLERHDAIVYEQVGTFGGRVVGDRGDGFLIEFGSASAAIACAEELCVSTAELGIELRAGLHAGECELLGDRLAGIAVHITARVSELAGPSEVLVSRAVRELVDASEPELVECGTKELRGVPGKWTVYALRSERLVAAAGAVELEAPQTSQVPLPPQTAARLEEAKLVDRIGELAACAAALERVRSGEQRTVMITGEPGIGKTRLAAEVAGSAHATGATVLCGRCDPELGLPYQPFVEVLTHYARFAPQEVLAQHRAQYGRELARLVPELGGGTGYLGSVPEHSRDDNRYLMFAAVAGLLRTATVQQPLVLVLDDLHWADKPTLLMLKYLLVSPQPLQALVIGTYRSTEVSGRHALAELLREVGREPGIERLELRGLEDAEAVALARYVADERLDPAGVQLVRTLREETNGNPLFLGELLRSLKDAGGIRKTLDRRRIGEPSWLDLPRNARDTITDRVARMGERSEQMLSAGAVLGREFDVELLARILEVDEEQLADVLDAAVDAELIAEAPGFGMRYSFVHPLIPRALYEQLRGGRRRQLHSRALASLEQLLGHEAREQRSGELARHALSGVPIVDAGAAVQYARQAGQHALEQLAPQEAMRWFEQALALHQPARGSDGREPVGDPLLCDLLIGQGIAQQQGGDAAFRATLLQASDVSRRAGDTERLVQAAIANTRGFVSETGKVDGERIEMLEAALSATGDRDSAARARLLATLAAELTFAGDWRRRKALSDESLAIARRLGDPSTVSDVLSARFMTIWTPETLEQRLADTARELAIAEESSDPVALFRALHWRATAAVEAGELDLAGRLVDREAELAERLRQPTASWLSAYDRATQALMHGLLDEAETSAEDAGRIAADSEQPEALAFYAGQLINIRFEQGRLGELEPLIAQQLDANPGIPAFRGALTLARCEAGMYEQAAEVLAIDAATQFEQLPYDSNWLVGLAIYAEGCAQLDELGAAKSLHRLLEPWRAQIAFNSATAWGSIERHLGNLDRVLGRYDEAEQALVRAADMHELIGAPIWLARTRVDLARVLIERDGAADRARTLLAQALGTARDLGCAGIERRAAELLEPAGGLA